MCHMTQRLGKYLKSTLGVVRMCQMIIIPPLPIVDIVTGTGVLAITQAMKWSLAMNFRHKNYI